MSSGGWLGHTLHKVVSAPFKVVGGILGGGSHNTSSGSYAQPAAPAPTVEAAPAPTVSEEAEYSMSDAGTYAKKKRGNNSLYVSTGDSGASTGTTGTGLNI
jgi:hypothetical protein